MSRQIDPETIPDQLTCSVPEAAVYLGITPSAVKRLIYSQVLVATRPGGKWVIEVWRLMQLARETSNN